MRGENMHELQVLLQKLGFSGKTAWQLEFYRVSNMPDFHLFYGWSMGDDTVCYALKFQRGNAGNYNLDGYRLSLTSVAIPGVVISDVDARVLEENLKRVDQYYDLFLRQHWRERLTKEAYQCIKKHIEATHATLERLASSSEGEEVAKLLMYKYWPEIRYRQHFDNYGEMERRYKTTRYFPINQVNQVTVKQSYQLLKASV